MRSMISLIFSILDSRIGEFSLINKYWKRFWQIKTDAYLFQRVLTKRSYLSLGVNDLISTRLLGIL